MICYLSKNNFFTYFCTFVLMSFIVMPTFAECVPRTDATLPDSPYLGYTNSGYKGAIEPDYLWQKLIRQVETDQESPSFVFKNNPHVRFANIEPISLGGKSTGFVVSKDGCMQLYNLKGKAILPMMFNTYDVTELDQAVYGKRQVLLELRFSEDKYLLVRFSNGHLKVASPRVYGRSTQSTILTQYNASQPYFKPVADSLSGQVGLVDLRSLTEVIAPEWSGVGFVNVGESQQTYYIMVEKNKSIALYDLDGKNLLIDNINYLQVRNNWFPRGTKPSQEADRAVLLIRKEGDLGCHLFNTQIKQLIPYQVLFKYGKCMFGRSDRDKFVIVNENDAVVHAYAVAPEAKLQFLSSIEGKLEAGIERTGLIVVSKQSSQGLIYQTYLADGTRTNEEDFVDFRNLGCDALHIKRQQDGAWMQLLGNGKLSSHLGYPVSISC